MKLIVVLFFLLPMNCFAITIGSEIGGMIGHSSLKTKEGITDVFKKHDEKLELGVFYRYNWNISNFIVSVKFLYSFLNTNNSMNNYFVDILYKYGTNFNFGYDIFDDCSLYAILGYNLIKYKYKVEASNGADKKEKLSGGGVYGIGIGYSFSISWKANLEYKIQNLEILKDLQNKINTLTLSFSYKF